MYRFCNSRYFRSRHYLDFTLTFLVSDVGHSLVEGSRYLIVFIGVKTRRISWYYRAQTSNLGSCAFSRHPIYTVTVLLNLVVHTDLIRPSNRADSFTEYSSSGSSGPLYCNFGRSFIQQSRGLYTRLV